MKRVFWLAALGAFAFSVQVALGQSALFDFESGGDQGWGHKFADDASETFPTTLIGGSNRMTVLRNGDFQEADRSTSNPSDALFTAMAAAAANEAGYLISYDWYIDTAPGSMGSFLQIGTYVNTGSGYYAQDFPDTGKDVELNGTQLASGQVFSGTVSETFAAKGYNIPAGETFFRLGLIMNGDGANATVHFDNIRVAPVPEPNSLGLLGSIVAGAVAMRRARSSRLRV
jgi:hypothetical protein